MQNSKLIELLKSLSKRKLSHFHDFIRSPYFNKNTDINLFFEYLEKYSPAFTHKNLDKKTAISKLNTSKKLNERSLAYLMNNLLNLLEKFLSIEKLMGDEFQTQQYLIQSFKQHHLLNNVRNALKKANKHLEKNPYKNADYYFKSYQISKNAYEQTSSNKRAFNEELQIAGNDLDVYFLVEKLRYCSEMLNLEKIINVKYDLQLGEEIIVFLNNHPLAEIPAISIYLNFLKMLKEETEVKHFKKVKQLLYDHVNVFSSEELKHLYTGILNYCTRKINRYNDEQYWLEYFEINKVLLKKELLYENGQLSPWRYTNIVHVGLKTNQPEWTKSFIEQYKNKLPEEYIENMYAYNLSLFYYYQKDYSKAQTLAFQTDSKDILLNILNRSLLIKIYFETEQVELLLFYLEANRIFLLRNKLIDPKLKKQMQRFIDFTKKLTKIESHEGEKLAPLKSSLPPATEVMHRDWLLEQINKKILKFK